MESLYLLSYFCNYSSSSSSPLLLHWLHSSRVNLGCLDTLFLTEKIVKTLFHFCTVPFQGRSRIDAESAGVLFQTEVNRWVSRICADTLLLENCLPLLPGHQNMANAIVLAVAVGRNQDVDNARKVINPSYMLL